MRFHSERQGSCSGRSGPSQRNRWSQVAGCALGALALQGLGSCGEDPAPEPRGDASVTDEDLSYLDELRHLGYMDHVIGPDGEESGVVFHDEAAAWDGINLYVSLPDSAGFLMDMQGKVLHRWHDRSGSNMRWSRVEVLPNGDAICLAPKENELIRMRWDGSERWRIGIDAHHDVRWTPEGEILVLTRELRSIPAVHPTRRVVDNSIARLNGEGELLASCSLYDLLSREPGIPIRSPEEIEFAPPEANVDPIHANTLEPVRHAFLADRHPMYAAGNVLLTLRYSCAVVMVNLESMAVLWFWGPGEIEGPHDATLLENGNILLLDNGWQARGYSRVLEVDPLQNKIVWEYRAPEPSDFFTSGRGTVQSLPGGNVLVGNSNSGEAFEVTRAGKIVWRFLNPNMDEDGSRGVLRVRRYAREEIDAIRRKAEG